MTFDALIDFAAEHGRVEPDDVQALASNLGVPVSEVIDTFARCVAERYASGDYSYAYADAAMNGLFSIVSNVNCQFQLTDLGWAVYHAFDQGEFLRSEQELQGEPLTRQLRAGAAVARGAAPRAERRPCRACATKRSDRWRRRARLGAAEGTVQQNGGHR